MRCQEGAYICHSLFSFLSCSSSDDDVREDGRVCERVHACLCVYVCVGVCTFVYVYLHAFVCVFTHYPVAETTSDHPDKAIHLQKNLLCVVCVKLNHFRFAGKFYGTRSRKRSWNFLC